MKKLQTIIAIFLLSSPLFAWPGSSGSAGSGPGFADDTNDVPVDGGIITVTALAIGYGVRQARKKKDDNNTDNGAV